MIHELMISLQNLIHLMIQTWFHWVEVWGYWGVFLLMAMESSILPVPSELVIPPAAYWAAQGRMDFVGVVVAGTLGSLFGSVLNYWAARAVGLPFVTRYGKYIFISPEKLTLAEAWVQKYGTSGIFFSRLLPVVRHLISIPAGLFRLKFVPFCIATTVGSAIWCTVLAWFGGEVIGQNPELLNSPETMVHAVKAKLGWLVGSIVVLGALYALMRWIGKRAERSPQS